MFTPRDFLPSFGRRWGRTLPPNQKKLLKEELPSLRLSVEEGESLNVSALFPDKRAIHLEIGFGAGEHLHGMAKQYPDVGFIGCEPYMNGVMALLSAMEDEPVDNIRVFTDDARLLLAALPERCIEQVYLLFPDPWPKARHHKRRLVSLDTLSRLARVQPKGAQLLLATDHVDYGGWMLEKLLVSPDYAWQAEDAGGWRNPPADWVETRYQQKTTQAGRVPLFINCVRR